MSEHFLTDSSYFLMYGHQVKVRYIQCLLVRVAQKTATRLGYTLVILDLLLLIYMVRSR